MGTTAIFALIGDPVDHSMSPLIQNTAFRSLGIDAAYVPFQVKPPALGLAVRGLRALGVSGFNITAPHKVMVMRYLDKLERTATEIGSVNTVVSDRGSLLGYNTDGVGAVNALRKAGAALHGESIVVVGAGGAGRAIAYAMASHARKILLANRTLAKATQLQNQLRRRFKIDISTTAISDRNFARFG